MRSKIESIVRHIFTGAAVWVVDNGWLSATDADESFRIIAALISIIVTRLIIWVLGKFDWVKFFNDASKDGANKLPMVVGMGMAAGFGFFLPSCAPTHYEVNTVPYTEQIKAKPEAVLVAAEDVTPIGQKFQADIRGRVRTDQGDFVVGKDGLEGELVIDRRSDEVKAAERRALEVEATK